MTEIEIIELKLWLSPEGKRYFRAREWWRKWVIACQRRGIDPMQHPKYQAHLEKIEKEVLQPLIELEKKLTKIKEKK